MGKTFAYYSHGSKNHSKQIDFKQGSKLVRKLQNDKYIGKEKMIIITEKKFVVNPEKVPEIILFKLDINLLY